MPEASSRNLLETARVLSFEGFVRRRERPVQETGATHPKSPFGGCEARSLSEKEITHRRTMLSFLERVE